MMLPRENLVISVLFVLLLSGRYVVGVEEDKEHGQKCSIPVGANVQRAHTQEVSLALSPQNLQVELAKGLCSPSTILPPSMSPESLNTLAGTDGDPLSRHLENVMKQILNVKQSNKDLLAKLDHMKQMDKGLLDNQKHMYQSCQTDLTQELEARKKLLHNKDLQLQMERARQQAEREKLNSQMRMLQDQLNNALNNEHELKNMVVDERIALKRLGEHQNKTLRDKGNETQLLKDSLMNKEAALRDLEAQKSTLNAALRDLERLLETQDQEKKHLKDLERQQETDKQKLQQELKDLLAASKKLKDELACQLAQNCAMTKMTRNLQDENQHLKTDAKNCQKNWKIAENQRVITHEQLKAPQIQSLLNNFEASCTKREAHFPNYATAAQQLSASFNNNFDKIPCRPSSTYAYVDPGKSPLRGDPFETEHLLRKVINLVASRVPKELCDSKLADTHPSPPNHRILNVFQQDCGKPKN